MSESEVDYAKRAQERKKLRNAGRESTLSPTERLSRQVVILADRLALALHIMSDHEQFISKETTAEQMKYLEDWVEELLSFEEPAETDKHARRFDYYRRAQRYTYMTTSIRALLRHQLKAPPRIPRLGEK